MSPRCQALVQGDRSREGDRSDDEAAMPPQGASRRHRESLSFAQVFVRACQQDESPTRKDTAMMCEE